MNVNPQRSEVRRSDDNSSALWQSFMWSRAGRACWMPAGTMLRTLDEAALVGRMRRRMGVNAWSCAAKGAADRQRGGPSEPPDGVSWLVWQSFRTDSRLRRSASQRGLNLSVSRRVSTRPHASATKRYQSKRLAADGRTNLSAPQQSTTAGLLDAFALAGMVGAAPPLDGLKELEELQAQGVLPAPGTPSGAVSHRRGGIGGTEATAGGDVSRTSDVVGGSGPADSGRRPAEEAGGRSADETGQCSGFHLRRGE